MSAAQRIVDAAFEEANHQAASRDAYELDFSLAGEAVLVRHIATALRARDELLRELRSICDTDFDLRWSQGEYRELLKRVDRALEDYAC